MPNPVRFVYRVDLRSPEEIFEHGFSTLGDVRNFFEHILSTNFGRSYFISTSETPTAAIRFFGSWLREYVPEHPRRAYLYEIRADQHFYNARATGENLLDLMRQRQVVFDSGDREMAQMGIRALRTSFAYQREWFTDGPIAAANVRSAWLVDAVPVEPGHAHHPAGRVVETTRINEPEMHNPHYQELQTQANDQPWLPTPGIATPVHLSIPQAASVADVSEGTSASLSFACPDWSPPSSNGENPLDKCIAEKIDNYNLQSLPQYASSVKELEDTPVYLRGIKTQKSFMLQADPQNNNVFLVEVNPKQKSSFPQTIFFWDVYQRICLKDLTGAQISLSLTAFTTQYAGQLKVHLSVSAVNAVNQKWKMTPQDIAITQFRVSSELLGQTENGLFWNTKSGGSQHDLYVCPLKNPPSDLEELQIIVDECTTHAQFVTMRAASTFFVDVQLGWYWRGYYYTPQLSGWSYQMKTPDGQIFYDLKTSKIFFVQDNQNVFFLHNKLNKQTGYSWDWVEWLKHDMNEDKDENFKWYFSRDDLTIPSVEGLNFRHIRCYADNQQLKVIISGSRWGGWYSTYDKVESNVEDKILVKDGFDRF